MRTMKFRAWVFEDKEMIEVECLEQYKRLNQKAVSNIKQRYPDTWEGKKFELMQFTGLKDKNKKDIYEGDIVEVDFGSSLKSLATVDWHKASFTLFYINDPEAFGDWIWKYHDNLEVVGNIYENPELLIKKVNA